MYSYRPLTPTLKCLDIYQNDGASLINAGLNYIRFYVLIEPLRFQAIRQCKNKRS